MADSPPVRTTTRGPPSADHDFETRREREFYAYYEAVLSLSNAPESFCNLNDPASVKAHHPVSSADRALTAFAQLAALRLQTRRAMIFFFDVDSAYVLAESTRSLSLQDDAQYDAGDQLWLGATKIPRGLSDCEMTTTLPLNAASDVHDDDSRFILHIINDLRADKRFCDRPCVQSGPSARFYAGAPITTSNGTHIGAICVLDDEPRDKMDDQGAQFLRDMATTIMEHLEMLRAKADNQRSRDMNVALGAFKEGKSRLQDSSVRKARDKRQNRRNVALQVSQGIKLSALRQPNSANELAHRQRQDTTLPPPLIRQQSSSASDAESRSSPTTAAHPESSRGLSNDGVVVKDFGEEHVDGNPHATAAQLQEAMLSKDVQDTLRRAAGLIHETLDVDGIIFLDASVGTFGGVVNSSETFTQSDSSATELSVSEKDIPFNSTRPTSNVNDEKFCPILAASISLSESRHYHGGEMSKGHAHVTEGFLRRILRRYPKGRVWNFDQDGDESYDDSCDEGLSSLSANESTDQDVETTGPSKRLRKRKRARLQDGREIQRLFPGVRSVITSGMWDSHKERWFAGSLTWTYDPTRSLSTESDLGFIAAFGDVILSEVGRIEANLLDRSKSDFISSISHELRSPLHGILGSAECLQDDKHELLDQEMIQSIHTCGTALLDIINNLLEHSQINNVSRKGYTARALDHRPSRKSRNKKSPRKINGLLASANEVPLDILTEEAVETACAGFIHRGRLQGNRNSVGRDSSNEFTLSNQKVVVTFNVDQTADRGWLVSVAAGAWKRICLNLVSNALKFTKVGYVTVNLHQTDRTSQDGKNPKANVVLTVTDSGSGMSRSFQTQSLFRPFQQEDGLSEGTGLGLNLVANIVESQSGNLQVKSDKGIGTSIIVTLPLECPETTGTASNDELKPHANVLVGFVGFSDNDTGGANSPSTEGRRQLLASLCNTCAQLGMKTYMVDDKIDEAANFHFILEHSIRNQNRGTAEEASALHNLAQRPLVVLCDTQGSALDLKLSQEGTALGRVSIYVWQPVGPAKVAKVADRCLNRSNRPSFKRTDSSSGSQSGSDALASSTDRSSSPSGSDASGEKSTSIGLMKPVSRPVTPVSTPKEAESETPTFRSIQRHRPKQSSPQRNLVDRLPIGKAEKRSSSPLVTKKQRLSLLLVDDNGVNLQLLMVYAKKSKHGYITAQDGLEAVEAYKRACSPSGAGAGTTNNHTHNTSAKPQVIIMDINMPVLNGFEASRQIREFEQKEGIEPATIIALTALGNTEAQIKAFSHGMDLFLTKPVRLKELTTLLDGVGRDSGSE